MHIDTWVDIPMPRLLTEGVDTPTDRDPSTSSEGKPGAGPPAESERVAAYARQLWSELESVSRYLREQVASGGSGPVLADSTPLLTNDEQWLHWRQAYAQALSTLAGPAGDEGYGAEQAQLLYQNSHAR
jgi:hypothetical protein